MTIAITGATGQLGRLVIAALKGTVAKADILALARTPARAADLDVTVREADYARPETLGPALAGVETLLLISSNDIGRRAVQHQAVIDAAVRAGVARIVYTSLLRADSSPLSLAGEHLATEAALRASGIPFTLLRNGWYAENHTASIKPAVAAGAYVGSAGRGRISWAARADYAAAAAVVLTTSGHDGKTYELAGDQAHSLADLAAEVSRQTGKDIPYRDLPVAEFAAILAHAGLPADFAHAIAGWDADAATGALLDDGRQLSGLIGRPTTPLAAMVADALR